MPTPAIGSRPPSPNLPLPSDHGTTAVSLVPFRQRNNALVTSQECGHKEPAARQAMKSRLGEAESRLRKLHTAIEAGVNPAALVEPINEAQAQRAAARAELEAHPPTLNALSNAEVYAMIDSLGDIKHALNRADPARLQELYQTLRLEMTYNPGTRTVDVTIQPARRGSERVRGGT